ILPIFRDHPEITQLLGQKARDRVLQRYTLTANISELETIYHQVKAAPSGLVGQL
ncbi:MAG: glycosyltransferase family 1 protein, partial [Nodosilinea sp.]